MYYRPEWTCGRYNAEHKVALMYNLIEGMSYFFEDDSATVISIILSAKRNGVVNLKAVAAATGIHEDSIADFFEELLSLNLLTREKPEANGITNYRKAVSEYRISHEQTIERSTKDKLPVFTSTAEMDYYDRVGGITSVMFELTYRCSEKCVHCYNIGATRNDDERSGRGDLKELNLDDYKRIIDNMYEMGLVKVCLTGGDPFSKYFAWEVIEYLYSKDIAFDVFTNGQSITNDVARLASFYPRIVGVSIYSSEAKVHDSITRIKGSWERSMSVIRQLSELAVPLEIKCCVMRPNVSTYRQIADIAKRYGARPQFELSITDSIEGDKCASKYLRLPKELMEVVLRDENIPLYVGKEAPNYGGQPKCMDGNACGAGDTTFCLTPDGELIPCCAFHLSFGNLKHQSVQAAYDSRERKQWINLKLEEYEDCGKHDYCDYCNLCAGNNYTEHSDPRKAGENNCYLAKIRFELAHQLMDGNDTLYGKSVQERIDELVLPRGKCDFDTIHHLKREFNS